MGLPRPNTPPQPLFLQFLPAVQIPPIWAFYPGQEWVQYQWTPAPVTSQTLAPQLVPVLQLVPSADPPPQFRATFDGTLGKLAYFLNCVWSHIDSYGDQYETDQDMILAIVDGMNKGEEAEWIAELHNEGAPEPEDADEFIQLL